MASLKSIMVSLGIRKIEKLLIWIIWKINFKKWPTKIITKKPKSRHLLKFKLQSWRINWQNLGSEVIKFFCSAQNLTIYFLNFTYYGVEEWKLSNSLKNCLTLSCRDATLDLPFHVMKPCCWTMLKRVLFWKLGHL